MLCEAYQPVILILRLEKMFVFYTVTALVGW